METSDKEHSADNIIKKEGVEVCGIHQEARRGDKILVTMWLGEEVLKHSVTHK
jgi:hypothetical protein